MDQRTPHGTANRYNGGRCRCRACRHAWAQYIRERRQAHGVPQRVLARRYWRQSEAYYPDKAQRAVRVRPTGLGLRILEAAQARTGKDVDDVIEYMLRHYSTEVIFNESDCA